VAASVIETAMKEAAIAPNLRDELLSTASFPPGVVILTSHLPRLIRADRNPPGSAG